ncbi:hypothetical protein C9374_003456 [Naegleria lovaniensis]|uniref:Uncharacterized protein n=1 Tax=Naegleria lovaniensis TaxID=51637 RepID=A0AA88GTR5_NAELO|nr:uncharacterized protein C9374_003456 [Naegleria lovaniensis]KAG2385641.1 hypothetical protein C9374_003456 [Naegleria lovaniensis]
MSNDNADSSSSANYSPKPIERDGKSKSFVKAMASALESPRDQGSTTPLLMVCFDEGRPSFPSLASALQPKACANEEQENEPVITKQQLTSFISTESSEQGIQEEKEQVERISIANDNDATTATACDLVPPPPPMTSIIKVTVSEKKQTTKCSIDSVETAPIRIENSETVATTTSNQAGPMKLTLQSEATVDNVDPEKMKEKQNIALLRSIVKKNKDCSSSRSGASSSNTFQQVKGSLEAIIVSSSLAEGNGDESDVEALVEQVLSSPSSVGLENTNFRETISQPVDTFMEDTVQDLQLVERHVHNVIETTLSDLSNSTLSHNINTLMKDEIPAALDRILSGLMKANDYMRVRFSEIQTVIDDLQAKAKIISNRTPLERRIQAHENNKKVFCEMTTELDINDLKKKDVISLSETDFSSSVVKNIYSRVAKVDLSFPSYYQVLKHVGIPLEFDETELIVDHRSSVSITTHPTNGFRNSYARPTTATDLSTSHSASQSSSTQQDALSLSERISSY